MGLQDRLADLIPCGWCGQARPAHVNPYGTGETARRIWAALGTGCDEYVTPGDPVTVPAALPAQTWLQTAAPRTRRPAASPETAGTDPAVGQQGAARARELLARAAAARVAAAQERRPA